MIFTVEETSIVNSFNHDSREAALLDIVGGLPLIRDEELKRVCKETAEKLKNMSDEDFYSKDFTVDFEK